MSFIIHNGKTPLSIFISNCGIVEKQRDIIRFSWNNYYIFSTKEEAEEHLKFMWKSLNGVKFFGKTFNRIHKLIENLKISEKK